MSVLALSIPAVAVKTYVGGAGYLTVDGAASNVRLRSRTGMPYFTDNSTKAGKLGLDNWYGSQYHGYDVEGWEPDPTADFVVNAKFTVPSVGFANGLGLGLVIGNNGGPTRRGIHYYIYPPSAQHRAEWWARDGSSGQSTLVALGYTNYPGVRCEFQADYTAADGNIAFKHRFLDASDVPVGGWVAGPTTNLTDIKWSAGQRLTVGWELGQNNGSVQYEVLSFT